LDALLTLKPVDVLPLLTARARRKINRGLTRKPLALIKKLNKAKKEAPEHDKPAAVKTHLRNMIIIPEMIGSVVGVYNGKTFNAVEIKPEVCLFFAKLLRHWRRLVAGSAIGDHCESEY
jgi:small subunit ribosomal protein S15e